MIMRLDSRDGEKRSGSESWLRIRRNGIDESLEICRSRFLFPSLPSNDPVYLLASVDSTEPGSTEPARRGPGKESRPMESCWISRGFRLGSPAAWIESHRDHRRERPPTGTFACRP